MSQTSGESAPRASTAVLAQLATAGFAGTVFTVSGFHTALAMLFAGGSLLAVGIALVLVLVLGLTLYGAAALAPGETWLHGKGGRVVWAVLVGGLGVPGWLLLRAVADGPGVGLGPNPLLFLLLGAVPFVLVAGMLLRRWYLAATALALTAALAFVLLRVLVTIPPDPAEVGRALSATGRNRAQFYTADLPGYRIGRTEDGWRLVPVNAADRPGERLITLTTDLGPRFEDCASRPQYGTCSDEQDGLTYQSGEDRQAYYLPKNDALLRLSATPAVERAVLRQAVLEAVPGPDGKHYTVQIPGYTQRTDAGPQTVSFDLTDPGQRHGAKYIEITVRPSASADPDPGPYPQQEGTRHGYLHRRAELEVLVLGGPGVPGELLDTAARTARPATDAEILDMLPPPRGRDRTIMGTLREFARTLVG